MAHVARCQDCSRNLEDKLGRSSFVETHDPGAPARKRPPRRYRSQTYEPLPKKRGHIRVLNLIGSGSENPLVECDLIVKRFSKEHGLEQPYEALSWCWGTMKPTSYINIRKDGKLYAKYVQPDLFAALKVLRYPKEDRYLWIDAICINQEDPQEKNHQVEMMSEIYGRAHQVCIWLGEGDTSSQIAMRFIKKEVLQLHNFDELCESELASEKWGALLDLMQRPWFSRRWVVQEIALARRAMVHCGNDRISWKKFAVAVELFVEVETATHRLSEVMKKDPKFYHVPGWFEYVSALGASLLVEATGKLFRDYKPNGPVEPEVESDNESYTGSESEPDSSKAFETDSDTESESEVDIPTDSVILANKGHPLLSLEYLVSSLSIFDVTMPHDAVYALLAIAKDTIPSAGDEEARLVLENTQEALEGFTQKKRYKVDYEQPFSDICKEFVQFCIDHSDPTRALDIIFRPWAPETRKSSPKRANLGTKKTTNVAASGLSEKRGPSPERKDQNGKKDIKESKDQAKPERKSPRRKKMKDPMPLPSWIPQLTGAAYAMLPQAGAHTLKMGRKNADTLVGLPSSSQNLQRNYNAAETRGIDRKTLRFRKRATMKHHSMYVKGFIMDTVIEIQPSSQGGAIPSGWARAGGWHNVPNSDPPDDFWRTLVADRGRDGRNPPVYYSRACKESFVKGGLSSGSVNTTDLINNERSSIIAQFCRRVQAVIWNRCLIKTQTGKLGLASQDAQLKDVVCILYGCSVPVVLRRKWKTCEQVEQEVNEDVRDWQKNFTTSWREVCKGCKAKRIKRALLRMRWARWDQDMQHMWQKDNEWRAKWDEKILLRISAQEKVVKDDLTKRIKRGEEEMGNFLKIGWESKEEYERRLRRKGYNFWKEEMCNFLKRGCESKEEYERRLQRKGFNFRKEAEKTNEKRKDNKWDEPRPNWREFELYLRFGRRWKAVWLKEKELANARQRLRSLEKEQPVWPAPARKEKQLNGVHVKSYVTTPEEAINGVQDETHHVMLEGIHDTQKPSSQPPKPDAPKDTLLALSADARTDSPERRSTPRNVGTDLSDARNKAIAEDDSSPDEYVKSLVEKLMKKFEDPEKGLQDPEHIIHPNDSEETQRLKQNWCYYEVIGECYVHGMMDGAAMAYQNDESIRAQVFELR